MAAPSPPPPFCFFRPIANYNNFNNNNYYYFFLKKVQVNLAKDVLRKVETNYEQHKEYENHLKNAQDWIKNAKEIVRVSSEDSNSTASKEELQARLKKVNLFLFFLKKWF